MINARLNSIICSPNESNTPDFSFALRVVGDDDDVVFKFSSFRVEKQINCCVAYAKMRWVGLIVIWMK